MRLRNVVIGVLWYLAGAAALLTGALVITGAGLLEVLSASDGIVLAVGALLVALGALTVEHLEYSRPGGGAPGEGGRPGPAGRRPVSGTFAWSSMAAVLGAALATAVTPRVSAETARVDAARGSFAELVIDGDRDGVSVTMDHDHANEALASRPGEPCAACHHASLPGAEATPCAECHRSMSGRTDVFDHDFHADRLGGNEGCVECHPSPDAPRTREAVRPCGDCHGSEGDHALWLMLPEGSRVGLDGGSAPSYVEAMHGACVECHRESDPSLARCPTCHRPGSVDESR